MYDLNFYALLGDIQTSPRNVRSSKITKAQMDIE